jgi:tetratricopeptide (TPR) repeat protein
MPHQDAVKKGKEDMAQGKWTDACSKLNKALEILDKRSAEAGPSSRARQKDRTTEGLVRAMLGNCLRMTGRFDEARKEFQKVRSIAEEAKDDHLMAEALMGLGFVAWRGDDHKGARRDFKKAIELADRSHDKYVKGMALMGLGNLDLVVRNLDEGVKVYEEARSYLESVPEARMDFARLLHNLAFLYYKKGERTKARELYKKALSISDSIGDVHISGFIHSNMAQMLVDEDKLAEAEVSLEKAGRLLARSNDRIGLNLIGWVRGLIKFKQDGPEEALKQFRKTKRGFEELGMAAQILNMMEDFIPVFKAAQHEKEALDIIAELREHFIKKDMPQMRARVDELERRVKG